jgi:hypothetical protein
VKLAVCVSTPVSFGGEISGRRSLGVFAFMASLDVVP